MPSDTVGRGSLSGSEVRQVEADRFELVARRRFAAHRPSQPGARGLSPLAGSVNHTGLVGPRVAEEEGMKVRMTTRDGNVYEVEGKPRAWKSALMRRAPYGTDVTGARFEVVREEEN